VLTKSHGSNNPVNVARATMKALESLENTGDIARRRHRRFELQRYRKAATDVAGSTV